MDYSAAGKLFVLVECFLATIYCTISCTVAGAGSERAEVGSSVMEGTAANGVVTGSFVFGDSLVDAGNNNYLKRSLATARAMPNGVDFPTPNASHPTGRFTNGLTIVDIIGAELGIPDFAPPFLAPTTSGSALLNGVNYASGGAGILNNTGRFFLQVIPMDVQLSYFEETVSEITQLLGTDKTRDFLAKSLFSITIGANDFLGNYIFPVPTTLERTIPPQLFIQKLLNQLKSQLMRLYATGARKFVVVNIPMMGCIPYLRSLNVGSNGSCSSSANNLALAYNKPLQSLLQQLNTELPGATLLYADSYGISSEIILNFAAYGFENADEACCGLVGSEKGVVPCRFPFVPMCDHRNDYFFWDPYHPSLKANRIIASAFTDGTQFISPINIRQLAAL